MGILLSILSVFGAIGSILKAIPPTVWLCVVCVIFGMFIMAKGCSCRAPRVNPVTIVSYDVIRVVSGNTIEVKDGPFGRRTGLVILSGISCPAVGPLAEEARKNLELSCGKRCTIATDKRIIRGRVHSGGVVRGETGLCLQLDQIEKGYASCTAGAPKDWIEAQALAKKSKRGIWK